MNFCPSPESIMHIVAADTPNSDISPSFSFVSTYKNGIFLLLLRETFLLILTIFIGGCGFINKEYFYLYIYVVDEQQLQVGQHLQQLILV